MFVIPFSSLQNSTYNIHQGGELVELFKVTKLIIWDEAPMAHKFCFEALDKTLKDIISFSPHGDSLLGGNVVVFGGLNFCQLFLEEADLILSMLASYSQRKPIRYYQCYYQLLILVGILSGFETNSKHAFPK